MQDAQTSQVDGYGGMKIGAASKGIIQRDFQHHATVFKSPYAKNPFDSVSNDELEEYKRIIDKKQRGETSPVIEDPGDTTDPGSSTTPGGLDSSAVLSPTTDTEHDEFRDQLERSLSLRQPPPGSAFARDTARSRSLGRPGAGASGLATILGILRDHSVEVLLRDSVEVFGIR